MSRIDLARIRDRMTEAWLTPSQRSIWKELQHYSGSPHHVVNVYGPAGCGKTFIGWLLERLNYSSYRVWPDVKPPTCPRLTLDDFPANRLKAREIRPLVSQFGIQQILLITRARIPEPDMPTFPLTITAEDMRFFRSNLYRYFDVTLHDDDGSADFATALA